MHEEAILFFTDLFQNDGSVLSVLDGDHTFLNESLAKHYGIPGVAGPEWRRVDGVKKYGRGGFWPGGDAREAVGRIAHQPDPARQLGRGSAAGRQAAAPAQERPACSPTTRPRPAGSPCASSSKSTPATRGAPVAIRASMRSATLSRLTTPSAAAATATWATGRSTPPRGCATARRFDGLDGLRHYLGTTRRDALVRQFCRKFLGYALGRGIQLSDHPLLEEMEQRSRRTIIGFAVLKPLSEPPVPGDSRARCRL